MHLSTLRNSLNRRVLLWAAAVAVGIVAAFTYFGVFQWPAEPGNSRAASGISFWLSVVSVLLALIGFPLTILALILTYEQLEKTRSAAEAAGAAVAKLKLRIAHYEAANGAAVAQQALDQAREHIKSGEWQAVARFYEEIRRCIVRTKPVAAEIDPELGRRLQGMAKQIQSLLKKIEMANGRDMPWPDLHSAMEFTRAHFDVLADLHRSLQGKQL